MPKKLSELDEDQLRRKQVLAAKRAARKQGKEENSRTTTTRTNSDYRDNSSGTHNTASSHSKADTEHRIDKNEAWLTQLPDDAFHQLLSLLSAAELGRLLLTSKSIHERWPAARVLYLQTRLVPALCPTPQACRDLIHRVYQGGHTGRLTLSSQVQRWSAADFVAYARYIEQAVLGHDRLDGTTYEDANDDDSILMLPKHCQGRWASASPEHSLCRVGGDGHRYGAGGSGVASWGVGKRGQLGHGRRHDIQHPGRLMQLGHRQARVVQVAAGGGLVRVAHSLVLTSTGQVYSFGTGQYGALGHGYSAAKQLPDVLRPTIIATLGRVRVTCVAAGELHSACVTGDGDCYTWGDGFCGQLGHGDKRPHTVPQAVVAGGLAQEVVVNITCGSRHTIAVTDDGEVFSWGLGHFGALGRPFTPFDYDADTAVAALRGGGEAAAAFGGGGNANALPPPEDGMAAVAAAALPHDYAPPNIPVERDYAAELAAHLDLIANLTLDDSSNQCIPVCLYALAGITIVGASAGHRHSLLLDAAGALFSFGTGKWGCLGHGDQEREMLPSKIMALFEDGIVIRQMSAGVDISMAVDVHGTVYSWGKTEGGRIGMASSRGYVSQPRVVPVTSVEDGRPLPVVDVECGYVHSIMVGLNGTIHVCGDVGVNGTADGSTEESGGAGRPRQVPDFNIWHRTLEPKEDQTTVPQWKKYGKYEIKGRRKMMEEG